MCMYIIINHDMYIIWHSHTLQLIYTNYEGNRILQSSEEQFSMKRFMKNFQDNLRKELQQKPPDS